MIKSDGVLLDLYILGCTDI